jgi:hypothetical protein
MITIALCDYVINSAAKVYYEVHSSFFGANNVLTLGFLLSLALDLGFSWPSTDFAFT